jgi:hypothetical protein
MKIMLVLGLISTCMIFLIMLVSNYQSNHWKHFHETMAVGQLCKYYPNETFLIVEILKIDDEEGIVFVLDRSEKLWKVQKSSLYPI